MLQCFPAHEATIMDVMGVPNCENRLLSISGDTTVRLWDLQHQQSTLYFGHEMSVRSVCFAPDSSNVFATGGRDGQIRLWDTRTSSFQRQGQSLKKPVNVYRNAHVLKDLRTPPKRKSTSMRLSGRLEKVEPPSVTSLVYANEYTLISASSNAKSGLRLWDTRKIAVKEEGHVLSVLEVPISKDAGVTSLCLDRFGSSLFAAVTDNCVYEYGILTSNTKPVRHFTGASIESFYVQVQASPVSDHLLCGSKNQQAVLWDLQDLHQFSDGQISVERQNRAGLPAFTLNGHDSEVCCVSWSCTGKYIASMDDEHFRIWSADVIETTAKEKAPNSNFEKATPYQLSESEKTMLLVNRMAIARDRLDAMASPLNNITSSRKRKEPFTSPIKRLKTPTKSPSSKIMKLASPVLPLSNITNATPGTPDSSILSTPLTLRKKLRRSAFHYRYPTENLPNRVYERFVAKIKARRLAEKQKASTPQTPQTASCTKRSMEDFCVRSSDKAMPVKQGRPRLPSIAEFADSVCSKMLSEQDRAQQNSPRKLTVKLTPLKSRPLAELREPSSSQRRSSRNLLDYFSKK
ncbi:WD domain, G-beta repeat protein [Ancylostoma caninum]|uniref:WD domain, G-beta repeat protein n=1 Tax=Ancylostoma caninum TaxID=29170 RepID=A0A368FRH1_ANCCA|nr:WD domain, G-beta repeat protein [Ancylostoma caninum]